MSTADVEKVARAMCQADGSDPDQPTRGEERAAEPAWRKYEHRARMFVVAFDAAKSV